MAWLAGSDPATTDALETSTDRSPKKPPVVGATDRLKVLPPGAGDAPAAGLPGRHRPDPKTARTRQGPDRVIAFR
ncbi:MAG: hypothetical protein U1F76_16750 [Candidatus Competibacteraceae bacterium]